jgi:hypothetical protein
VQQLKTKDPKNFQMYDMLLIAFRSNKQFYNQNENVRWFDDSVQYFETYTSVRRMQERNSKVNTSKKLMNLK